MSRVVLQIPVNAVLRKDAEKAALEQGFSSLQEAVRVFLKKLAKGALGITFEEEDVIKLSPRAIKRYNKIIDDIEKGKNVYRVKDVNDLMKQLNAD